MHNLSLSLLRVSSESISTSALSSSYLEAAALQILCSLSAIAVITAPDTASTPLLSSPTSVGGKTLQLYCDSLKTLSMTHD